MPVSRFKPTSPGRRFMTVSDFAEVTKSKPEKALTETLTRKGGRNNQGRITTRHQGGGHKRRYRLIDFKRTKDGVPGEGRGDRVRPEPLGADRAPPLRRRLQVLHPGAGGPARRLDGPVGAGRRHQAGQRAAAREHPHGHARAQRRAEAGPGRPDGPLGGLGHPARRQGRRLRDAPPPVGRDAPRADDVPRDGRPGRQRRPRQPHRRQGRSQPLAGQAPDGARLGHEPGRPSARRRRGQVEGRSPPRHTLGRADARQAHPFEAQGIRQADRSRPPPRKGRGSRR